MAVVGEIGVEPVDEFQWPDISPRSPARASPSPTAGWPTTRSWPRHRFRSRGRGGGQGLLQDHRIRQRPAHLHAVHPAAVPIEKNPSAIVRMAPLMQRIEEWAYGYEQKNRYECAGGTIVPKVNIGAIRGGVPYKITKTVQQCAI